MKYRVWCDGIHDGPDDGRVVEALDASEAAEKWAEWNDHHSADYNIVGGTPEFVNVRPERGGEQAVYEVTGRSEPVYSARKVSSNVGIEPARPEQTTLPRQ